MPELDTNPTDITAANQLLDALFASSTPASEEAPAEVLQRILEGPEYEAFAKNPNLEEALGVYIGSTAQGCAEVGLDGERAANAVRLLKAAGRIAQGGRGRGKALVVFSNKPIKPADIPSNVLSTDNGSARRGRPASPAARTERATPVRARTEPPKMPRVGLSAEELTQMAAEMDIALNTISNVVSTLFKHLNAMSSDMEGISSKVDALSNRSVEHGATASM